VDIPLVVLVDVVEAGGDAAQETDNQYPLEHHGKGPVRQHVEVPQLHTEDACSYVCPSTALQGRRIKMQ